MAALIAPLAQYQMDYGDHMNGGWAWVMGAFMVLVVLGVFALAVWLVRTTSHTHAHPRDGAAAETPLQILDRRLATGEIAPEEYQQRAAILGRK